MRCAVRCDLDQCLVRVLSETLERVRTASSCSSNGRLEERRPDRGATVGGGSPTACESSKLCVDDLAFALRLCGRRALSARSCLFGIGVDCFKHQSVAVDPILRAKHQIDLPCHSIASEPSRNAWPKARVRRNPRHILVPKPRPLPSREHAGLLSNRVEELCAIDARRD